MTLRRSVLAALGLYAALLLSPPDARAASPSKPPDTRPVVVLTTSLGEIRIALETQRAPVTAANFLRYVDAKRLDGTTFYRALKHSQDGTAGLVQGGLRNRSRGAFPPIAHESTVQNSLAHLDGAVSMARDDPGSARGEFFIVVGDMRYFDAVPNGGDPGFAVFGKVVSGMPIVRRMLRLPRSKDAESLHMKDQMLAQPVQILSAARAAP
jgi:peptidyl-prolyl cis-trans isomerase A (cyclophilin A)